MKRQIHFLCPECTFKRDFSVEAFEYNEGSEILASTSDNGLYIGFQLVCPKCGTYMYQADKELIPTLKLLHKNNLCPIYHCDRYHEDIQLFDPKNLTRNINGEEFYSGPYIALRDLTKQEIFELGIVVGKINTELKDFQVVVDHSKSYTRSMHGNKRKFSKTQINVYSRSSNPNEIQLASRFLTKLIEDWIERLNMYEREDKGIICEAIPSYTPFYKIR